MAETAINFAVAENHGKLVHWPIAIFCGGYEIDRTNLDRRSNEPVITSTGIVL